MNTDVLVIGVGSAGLTARLVLARAQHWVTLIDAQTYRNATVDAFHGRHARCQLEDVVSVSGPLRDAQRWRP